jgi:hypothetical protein
MHISNSNIIMSALTFHIKLLTRPAVVKRVTFKFYREEDERYGIRYGSPQHGGEEQKLISFNNDKVAHLQMRMRSHRGIVMQCTILVCYN